MKKIYIGLFVFLFFLAVGIGITSSDLQYKEMSSPVHTNNLSVRTPLLSMKDLERTITLAGVGDMLIHGTVYTAAKTTNGYDFNPMFAPVKNMLEQPDILLANQETILAGVDIGLSTYPSFNSPQELGHALIENGVDIVSTANNHSLDRGGNALVKSIDFIESIQLPNVGTYRSFEEQKQLQVVEKNGLKIGYMSYTYGTNGIPVPQGREYLVNLIDKTSMSEEISRMKEVADVLVMSIHWGNEYVRYPNDIQKDLAQFLTNEGVDIIFGHHPHVLQPMQWLYDEKNEPTLVIYSLGNFLSGQVNDFKDIGGMATVQIKKNIMNKNAFIEFTNVGFEPTIVTRKSPTSDYKILPMKESQGYLGKSGEEMHKELLDFMLGDL